MSVKKCIQGSLNTTTGATITKYYYIDWLIQPLTWLLYYIQTCIYVLHLKSFSIFFSAKSLFAIPKNEEFVYISAESDRYCARDVSSLIRGLVQLCAGAEPEVPPQRSTFREFLQGHLDLAFGEGFDDNVGKYAMSTSFFEVRIHIRLLTTLLCKLSYLNVISAGAFYFKIKITLFK